MNIPAIEINNVSKYFGSGKRQNLALNDVSLVVNKGDVFGFLGPNGAGKSTTIKLLLRFLRPDNGSLHVLGKNIADHEYRHSIGYLAEFPFFYDHLTANETLMLSGRLSGLKKREILQRIPNLLERMNLKDAAGRKVGGFSKGMKQRLGMANALIHDPEIMIFDEPMSGLDPVGRHMMKTLIMDLKREEKTIFFSSHILSDIESLCNSISIINKGKILFTGDLASFLEGDVGLEERFISIIEEDNNESSV